MKKVDAGLEDSARGQKISPVHAVLLKPGIWKQQFTSEQSKLVIAETLNLCAYHKGLHIAGYLITDTSFYLILKIQSEDFNRLMAIFYDVLRKQIKHYQPEAYAGEMFTQHPVRNYKLISLITGYGVTLPYHDPYLTWLKNSLHHYNYCSIIDYEGGRGPVRVSLL